mmetsp:Transcript_23388/g.59315  ORF Transcript_23388/g.59315 Transcript_23388/m.59315 type:complete len:330 (+) Transcript_23388:612-1601(+)
MAVARVLARRAASSSAASPSPWYAASFESARIAAGSEAKTAAAAAAAVAPSAPLRPSTSACANTSLQVASGLMAPTRACCSSACIKSVAETAARPSKPIAIIRHFVSPNKLKRESGPKRTCAGAGSAWPPSSASASKRSAIPVDSSTPGGSWARASEREAATTTPAEKLRSNVSGEAARRACSAQSIGRPKPRLQTTQSWSPSQANGKAGLAALRASAADSSSAREGEEDSSASARAETRSSSSFLAAASAEGGLAGLSVTSTKRANLFPLLRKALPARAAAASPRPHALPSHTYPFCCSQIACLGSIACGDPGGGFGCEPVCKESMPT